MELFTVNECKYMFAKEKEIIQKVKPIDDGGLDVLKKVMIEVLGEDCPRRIWNEVFDDVINELGA